MLNPSLEVPERPFAGKKMTLLKVVVLAVSLLMLVQLGLYSAGAPNNTKTPIKHLIILMMENHSFDNTFGRYGKTSAGNIASGVTIPYNLISHPVSQQLNPVGYGNFSTSNPYEGYTNYHEDWNDGKMNGFLNGSGPSSLYYFTADQMGLEWALAQNYAIGDMYFSSTLSETLPNRLYSLAGYSPVVQDQISPPPYLPYNQTVFSELDSYGVSWAYYLLYPSLGTYPLNYISGFGSKSQNIGSWQQFTQSVQHGSLPDVTWVSPIDGGASHYSEHPPDNILIGEIWLFNIIDMVMKSGLWNSTAIFVTYDEGGGYYDQVPPPQIGSTQLGFRVPFMVISPYAKEDYISHTVLSHTSILGFIDYNWKMPPLNRLVSQSNVPLDLFNFNVSYPNGNVARGPLQFNASFQEFLTQTLNFNESIANRFQSIGFLFPMAFQYNVSRAPYPLQGESSFNLSQVTNEVYVPNNHSILFSLADVVFGSAVVSVVLAATAFFYLRWKKRMESR